MTAEAAAVALMLGTSRPKPCPSSSAAECRRMAKGSPSPIDSVPRTASRCGSCDAPDDAQRASASIEALAGSIAHKDMLQNLIVRPGVEADGTATGCYIVTAGEGSRLAQERRATRGETSGPNLCAAPSMLSTT